MFLSLLAGLASVINAAPFPAVDRSTSVPIIVVYPSENAVLPPISDSFILGSVNDPHALFTINGATVPLSPQGAFLAWVPVSSGAFTFSCALAPKKGNPSSLFRSVTIGSYQPPLPAGPLAIDANSISPRSDQGLRPGDWLYARLRASPGQPGRFRLPGRDWQPLRETGPGVYEGSFLVSGNAPLTPAPIEFNIGSGWARVSAKSTAKISIETRTPAVAMVKSSGPVSLKPAPGEGELFTLLPGAKLIAAGFSGNETKVLLGNGLSGWVETKSLELLPGAAAPRYASDTISLSASTESSSVRVSLPEKLPFSIEEDADLGSLTVRIHYAYSRTNWMVYDSSDDLIDQVRLRQEAPDLLAVVINLKNRRSLWGYNASYDGSALKVELRRPPRLGASVLAGRRIFLDPGHMPSAPGAVGPLGTREMDVNFALAKETEKILLKEKAVPLMSRVSPEDEVALADRPRMAWEKKAELFVSLHNNFLPDGSNPFAKPRGYSVFYFHPHSFPFAREVHRSFSKRIPLPDENLRFGNLLVARATQMPAILVETAYMIYPEQEAKLLDPRFRKQAASAVVEGIRSFLIRQRAAQASAAPARTGP